MWGSPQLIDNFVFKQTNIVMSIDHYIHGKKYGKVKNLYGHVKDV